MRVRKRDITKRFADSANPYSWIMAIRNRLFDIKIMKSRTFAIPTICIGNITVGGTGKTPHTEYLIALLKDNYNVAVLSRGYGRKSRGYILAGADTPMKLIGDEPFQIKSKFKDITVAVCEKRTIGIEKIEKEGKDIDVILLDDAFQHRYVKAGLNILLIDSERPLWQDCTLPFGRLREKATGIKRADIVVITKCEGVTPEQKESFINYIKEIKDIPVFFSRMRYGVPYRLYGDTPKQITKNSDILLVTAIARPEPLKREIERDGANAFLMRYSDHHNFTAGDMANIEERYNKINSENKIILTTEKDATRFLQRNDVPQTIRDNIYVIPIEVEIMNGEENMFNKIISDYVTENSRNS